MTTPTPETYPRPFELHAARVCADCLQLLANGETPTDHGAACWHPDPDRREAARRGTVDPDTESEGVAAYLAAVAAGKAPGWELIPGCPGCEWCRECEFCGQCEAWHPDPDDPGACPGPVGGWTDGAGIGQGEGRADHCPNDEGEFRWSPCDLCGWPPGVSGGTLYPAGYLYDPRQDPRRDPDEARRAIANTADRSA